MNEIKRLTQGMSAALLYDFCCMKGNLFGESYLTTSMGEILQSLHGGKSAQVIAGYQHPTLSKLMKGRGRRPELDFVVSTYDDSSANQRARSAKSPVQTSRNASLLLTAIETKWAGSSHCTPENILWDILRLEMLVFENPTINAILLIAGHEKKFKVLEKSLAEFLKFDTGQFKIEFISSKSKKNPTFKKLFSEKSLVSMDFPEHVQVSAESSLYKQKNSSKMKVIAWSIKNTDVRKTFQPKDWNV